MTDDDVERRLQQMLSGRAEQVEPALFGPRLRGAAGRPRPQVSRVAAVVLAAAAVVLIALLPQVFTRLTEDRSPQQPGSPATIAPTRQVSTSPSPSPSAAPSAAPSATPPSPQLPAPPQARPTPGGAPSGVPRPASPPAGGQPSAPPPASPA